MATSTGLQNHKSLKMIFYFCLILSAAELIQAMIRDEMKFVLNYHNILRRREHAANMMKLIWSEELEYEASAYAELCKFELQNKGRGENMAFNINRGARHKRIKNAIDAWFSEKKDVKWSGNKCISGCHYTQLVWAKTTEIGCSSVRCPSLRAFGKNLKHPFFFVCFYSPKGNTGKPAYLPGAPCSKCPMTAECKRKLCVSATEGSFMSGGRTTNAGNSTDTGDYPDADDSSGHSSADCDDIVSWLCKYLTKRIFDCEDHKWLRNNCEKSCKMC